MLVDVRRSVAEALVDRVRLQQVLAGLDPERATAELKAALRARVRPDEPDDQHIAALRRPQLMPGLMSAMTHEGETKTVEAPIDTRIAGGVQR